MKQEKLPKEFKEKWVKALRSGQYKQMVGSLKTEIEVEEGDQIIGSDKINEPQYAYCVLGVASKVAGAEPTIDASFPRSKKLPKILRKGELPIDLADKNDMGWNFKELATWIDKNL